ncbi:MAG: hypothetical protein IKO47_13110 [Ruminococcus sp.]|nr:hypothetical protein [Ruminococcus sp.]
MTANKGALQSSVPTDVAVYATVNVAFKKGAEGSTVTTKKDGASANVKNNTRGQIELIGRTGSATMESGDHGTVSDLLEDDTTQTNSDGNTVLKDASSSTSNIVSGQSVPDNQTTSSTTTSTTTTSTSSSTTVTSTTEQEIPVFEEIELESSPVIKGQEQLTITQEELMEGPDIENAKTLSVGSFIFLGDTVKLQQGEVFRYTDQHGTVLEMTEDAYVKVNKVAYDFGDWQYSFGFSDGTYYYPLTWFTSLPYSTTPLGFFVTSGDGTLENPYSFALTLTLDLPEDGGVKAEYTYTDEELDPSNINPYGVGEYGERQNYITYTSEKPFVLTTEDGEFSLPSYDEEKEEYILTASCFGDIKISYIENDVIPVSQPHEFYEVISMLNEAYIRNEVTGYDTILRLTKDIDLSMTEGERTVYGNLTIDLNGHTLNMAERSFLVESGFIPGDISSGAGTLSFSDTSAEGTGKVTNTSGFHAYVDQSYAPENTVIPAGGNVIVNGGYFELAGGCTITAEDGCSITFNNGTFSTWNAEWGKYLGSGAQSIVQNDDSSYTIAPPALCPGTYRQTAEVDGKRLTRFVFVKPISELEGKTRATFTARYNGREITSVTHTYYTGMRFNGQQYMLAKDCVLFAVTIAGVPEEDEWMLSCRINLT